MKRISNIIAVAAMSLLLAGCGLYKKYEQKTETPANVFGANADGSLFGVSATDSTSSIAQTSWREFFTDPLLQQLIELALSNNTDLNSARIAVEKSEASLKAAKMAYLPSLYFAPQGTLAKFDTSPWSKTYNLPLQLSWDVDVFGSITNKKRAAKAVLLQAQLGEEAVRTNLISTVAQLYYMLELLDSQLDILTQTDSLWNASLETQKSLWENGKSYGTAVNPPSFALPRRMRTPPTRAPTNDETTTVNNTATGPKNAPIAPSSFTSPKPIASFLNAFVASQLSAHRPRNPAARPPKDQ